QFHRERLQLDGIALPPTARFVLRISVRQIDRPELKGIRGEPAGAGKGGLCSRQRFWAERRRLSALLFCDRAGPDPGGHGTDGSICRAFETLSIRGSEAVRVRIKAPNTKHQTPMKLQVPSSKHRRGSKFQARSAARGLELGTWDLFGVWSLVFGVSIPVSCAIRVCVPGFQLTLARPSRPSATGQKSGG